MKISFLVVFIFGVSLNVNGAGIDCGKAVKSVERRICGDSELSRLDGRMVDFYQQVLTTGNDPDRMAIEQAYWVRSVRNKCETKSCLKRAYRIRILELDASAYKGDPKKSPADIPQKNHLSIIKRKDGLFDLSFNINGANVHACDFKGAAKPTDSRADHATVKDSLQCRFIVKLADEDIVLTDRKTNKSCKFRQCALRAGF